MNELDRIGDELQREVGETPGEDVPFNAEHAALQTLAERELCRRNLLAFVMKVNPSYQPGWVHRLLCKKLEKFAQDVVDKKSPRLMIWMPPRHGKSELASRSFPAWFLGKHPDKEIIACSYAASLALKFSRKARAIAREPFFYNLFGVELDKDQQSSESWLTDKGGGYMPAGVNGPITGNGAHVLLIDDPVKNREEADSPNTQENTKDWYTSTAYTRLAPGGGVCIIQTRWSDADLSGWQMQEMIDGSEENWEVLNFPAIATQDEPFRKEGEALHEERYPIEALLRIQRVVGPRDFGALYQQNPVPDEGAYFSKDMIRYYRSVELPDQDELTYYTAWDFAIAKGEENDYTVGVTVAFDKKDRIFVVDVQRGKWDSYEIVEKILDTYVAFTPAQVGMEKGQISHALGPHLEARIRERNLYAFPYSEDSLLKPGRKDKALRARSIQGRMRQGRVFFPEDASFTNTMVHELLRFPSGVNDDQVDALAYIGIMMTMFHHTTAPVEDDTPQWLKRYLTNQALSPSSAMSA